MRTIYIHIGFNKTGTTSIQNDLVINAGNLAQQGYLYPYESDAIYIQRWQHLPLAAASPGLSPHWLTPRKRKTVSEAFDAVLSKIGETRCENVILSSEGWGIAGKTVKAAIFLKKVFHPAEVKIVAYIRRQDTYALSCYQEGVKDGRTVPLQFEKLFKNPTLYFDRRLEPWRVVFGRENVLVRPFSPQTWVQKNIFLDFLSAIGASCSNPILSTLENEGLDYRAVELIRRMNEQCEKRGLKLKTQRRLRLMERLKEEAFAADLIDDKKFKLQFSNKQSSQLRNHFEVSNLMALQNSGYSINDLMPIETVEKEERILPKNWQEREIVAFIDQFVERIS